MPPPDGWKAAGRSCRVNLTTTCAIHGFPDRYQHLYRWRTRNAGTGGCCRDHGQCPGISFPEYNWSPTTTLRFAAIQRCSRRDALDATSATKGAFETARDSSHQDEES